MGGVSHFVIYGCGKEGLAHFVTYRSWIRGVTRFETYWCGIEGFADFVTYRSRVEGLLIL